MRLHSLAWMLALLPATAMAAVPPAEAFFSNARYSAAKMSPEGTHVAIRGSMAGRRDALYVVELNSMRSTPVAQYGDADIDDFEWVNEQRLVYDTRDRNAAVGDLKYAPGLFAVNRDGGGALQLVDRGYDQQYATGTHIKQTLMPWNTYLLVNQPGRQDSDHVYVERPEEHGGQTVSWTLMRLNTKTGRAMGVAKPPFMQHVLIDAAGEARAATSVHNDRASVHYRDPGAEEWRKLAEFPAYGVAPDAFSPVGFGPDGMLYVATGANSDRRVVRSYDVKTGKLSDKAVIDLGEYDFRGSFVTTDNNVLGVRLLTDARSTHWWNKEMAALQDTVDQLLPGTVNEISVPRRGDAPWVLVKAWSDRQPPVYVVYNKKTRELKKLGDSGPAIQPAAMGSRSIIHYTARDGMKIPAWLTMPPGGKKDKLPLVVLVHGGPFMRGGEWNWDAEAQFLATRGYAVLQPEFRGSTGFGARHFQAGFKQWGLAMQDDLSDGARALVQQGVADGNRICIAGASYGGYAALMGIIKDGDLFKCAVNWVGVTDINLLYTGTWRIIDDLSDNWKKYGMPLLVGDPVKDAEQLQATSPLAQAAKIKRPVLLAYGTHDRRVPIVHGERFYKAVKAHNPDVEWIAYDGEGHGWTLPENRIDFWTRVERFLDKHIGSTSQPQ